MNFGKWLGLSSFIISCYILWEIRQVLLLVFTAVVFATALNRLVKLLRKFNIGRNFAITIIVIAIIFLSILFGWLVVPPFIDQFEKLLELLPNVWERLRNNLISLSETQSRFDWLPPPPSLSDLLTRLQPLLTEVFANFFTVFSNSLLVILQVVFVFFLTITMVINPQNYRSIFLKLFPSFYRKRGEEILDLSEVALGNWLTGVTINCLFIGTLSGIGLLVLQVKLVLVHALLAG